MAGNKRDTFKKELRMMMYGFGDAEQPLAETVQVVEALCYDFITSTTSATIQAAPPQRRNRGIHEKDLLFAIRKDRKKYLRARELMVRMKDIKAIKDGLNTGEADLKEMAAQLGGAPGGAGVSEDIGSDN
eukprot:m51a1_g3350 hypothetical protein (130) ;mRNA; f:411773-412492